MLIKNEIICDTVMRAKAPPPSLPPLLKSQGAMPPLSRRPWLPRGFQSWCIIIK